MPARVQSVLFVLPVLPFSVLLTAALPHAEDRADDGWASRRHPCADSLGFEGMEEGLVGRAFGYASGTGLVAGEDCDPDEALLFQRIPSQERTKESRHTSFSLSRNSGKPIQSMLRNRATHGEWDHRLEIDGDTLSRFQLGWRGHGWRMIAGDLVDENMLLWPRQLPRRTLPRGWQPARGTPENPQSFSPARPQGLAAGVSQPGWSAYALRTWNPVESGTEPPWHAAWELRHIAAGAALSPFALPWTLALHASETRVTRGTRLAGDSMSESLLAASLASPDGGLDVIIARSESDPRRKAGWMIGAELQHELTRESFVVPGMTLNLTMRQRSADWASAWDPAVDDDDEEDSTDRDWGAGEVRMEGRVPFYQSAHDDLLRDGKRRREQSFLHGELWRAWNPAAGTERQGARGTFGWRTHGSWMRAPQFPGARFEMTATHRTSRAASGSVSLYRYVEAETRLESFPRWRASVWRAWNREGPQRAGMLLGAEPAWKTSRGSVALSPGLRLEVKEDEDGEDELEGAALLGLRWRPGFGWSLDASASLPCWPPAAFRDAAGWNDARWRVTVTTGR
jgi:hypothetical protein